MKRPIGALLAVIVLFCSGCCATPSVIEVNGVVRAQNEVESLLSQAESEATTGEDGRPETMTSDGEEKPSTTTPDAAGDITPYPSGETPTAPPSQAERPAAEPTNAPAADTALSKALAQTPTHVQKTMKAGGKTMVVVADVVIPEGVSVLHTFSAVQRSNFDVDGLIHTFFGDVTPEYRSSAYRAALGRNEGSLRVGGRYLCFGFTLVEQTAGNRYLGPATATNAPGCQMTFDEAQVKLSQFLQRFSLGDFRVLKAEINDQMSYQGAYSATGSYTFTCAQFADGLPIRTGVNMDEATLGYVSMTDAGYRQARFQALDLTPTREVNAILSLEQVLPIVEKQWVNAGICCSEYSPYWRIDLEYMLDGDGNVAPCWRFFEDSSEALQLPLENSDIYVGSDFVVNALTGTLTQVASRYPAMLGEDGKVHIDKTG